MKKHINKKILLSLYHYFSFFVFMAFIITCSMLLFLSTMAKNTGIIFTENNINTAAIVTFCNVVFLALVCTVIDAVRKHFTVERPVKKIISAAEQIAKGDYSVRISPSAGVLGEDGFDRIAECLNSMARELSGIETLKSDFIANVSHEIKTPLARMQNYAALLMMPDVSEDERKKYSAGINDSCIKLAELITNILKLNKLENQQIYPDLHEYHLGEQLCESLLSFENVWTEKDINIETDIDDNIKIYADSELMSIVWNNLLSNAFKFTGTGGTVSLSMKMSDSHAVVTVKDSGCGISADVGAHIFDKFYQGDPSHTTNGNGLGLALVKRVIDIMGAEISVFSEPGKGSTFTVKLKQVNYE